MEAPMMTMFGVSIIVQNLLPAGLQRRHAHARGAIRGAAGARSGR
jgi:hypothetical protein